MSSRNAGHYGEEFPSCRSLRVVTHIGVTFALVPKSGHGSMSGNKSHIIAQGPQLATDRANPLGMVTLGKIGAANGIFEQHIPHQGQTRSRAEENHMTRRMARAVKNLKGLIADGDGIAIMQQIG